MVNITSTNSHPQATAVLKGLEQDNPATYARFQAKLIAKAAEMVKSKTGSDNIILDPIATGITSITCHMPTMGEDGTRVLKYTKIDENETDVINWDANFTGPLGTWRARTMGGIEGNVEVELEKGTNLIIDLKNTGGTVIVTNITTSNPSAITYGGAKRGVSTAHLIKAEIDLQKETISMPFNKGDEKMRAVRSTDLDATSSDQLSLGELAVNLAEKAIMPIDNSVTYDDLVQTVDEEKQVDTSTICGYLIEAVPDIANHCFTYGPKMDGVIIKITGDDNKTLEWAKNPQTWELLISHLATKCLETME